MDRYRRALLESLKYLSAKEVLLLSPVNRLWQELCTSDEIWLALLGKANNESRLMIDPAPSLKSAYRQFNKKSVYYVSEKEVCSYNVCTSQLTVVPLSEQLPEKRDIKVVFIGGNSLFCLNSGHVFGINCETGVKTELPQMAVSRLFVGLILYSGCVYALCGRVDNRLSRLCSLFALRRREWTELPDALEPRQAFNPALYQENIILANGCCASVEILNTKSKLFTMLPINTGLKASSSSFIIGDQIYILGLAECSVWSLQTFEEIRRERYHNLGIATSKCPPVTHGNKSYLIESSGWVLELDLVSLRWNRLRSVSSTPSSLP